ncbi:hypothetical protein ABK040_016138 [Willaertia magna]
MLQHLPQELFIHIFSLIPKREMTFYSDDLMKLIKVISSVLNINKEIKNKILSKSFFNILLKDCTLGIYCKEIFYIYKHLRKITNNLFEISNFRIDEVDLMFVMKHIKYYSKITINVININDLLFLKNVKNLTVIFNYVESYEKLKQFIINFPNL